MANIYKQNAIALYKLLENASGITGSGATVLIPDLQRPYVWSPKQVILLIDSLIRGWPFGTLLMWVNEADKQIKVPHRAFWHNIDRVGQHTEFKVGEAAPPAQFNMVLDGQQRIQSLLIALINDSSGFVLDDKEWSRDLSENQVSGNKTQHYCKGNLFFNITRFKEEYKKAKGDVGNINYQIVLEWRLSDKQEDHSPAAKNKQRSYPLQSPTDDHIRLSQLWALAGNNPSLKEKGFRQKLSEKYNGKSEKLDDELVGAMAELLGVLCNVKLCPVTYLELQPFDDTWTEDAYNDAIVNIFTRLNTAGRTLTREEIIFAWLKTGWQPEKTAGNDARLCFETLQKWLQDDDIDIDIEIDELVRCIALLWAIHYNKGNVLADKDILKIDVLKQMSVDLSENWKEILTAIQYATKLVKDNDLEYGKGKDNSKQYASLNALTVIWCWYYAFIRWKKGHHIKNTELDNIDNSIWQMSKDYFARWFVCSQWAGLWAGGTTEKKIPPVVKVLQEYFQQLIKEGQPEQIKPILREGLKKLTAITETEAEIRVKGIEAAERRDVSDYQSILWVWNRLDKQRWESAKTALQEKSSRKKYTKIETDHIVAYGLWEDLVKAAKVEPSELNDWIQVSNQLGNMLALEKTFNIAKSKDTLLHFLEQLDGIEPSAWSKTLGIPDLMLNPGISDGKLADKVVREIKTEITERTKIIREEVIAFVKGEKQRVDI